MSDQIPDDHDIPWAMQLAVYRDRQSPARQVDVAETAARAVVALLADPRSAPDGPWYPAVKHWRDARIRKLVRRADGKRWTDVQELDGVTVTQAGSGEFGDAAVRAFVPGPVKPLPKELNKLQVSGTTFPDDGASNVTDAKVTVEVRPGLEMTSGKLAAQCAHAAQLAWEAMSEAEREQWRADDFRVRVDEPREAEWAAATRPVAVVDAGLTELDGPTETTRAWW
ncbi:peptidyl-tRNA hydrolase [Kocuria sp. CPCC 205235]|uniref:peptidyl-tRNA hydrolase n=1 Tax=Kocuria sp. CPCC 205235 TaxID=3073549 RepID=UPI0034D5A5A6